MLQFHTPHPLKEDVMPNAFSISSNQAPCLQDYNAYQTDPLLQSLIKHYQANWVEDNAHQLGQEISSEQWQQWVIDANRYPPQYHRYDAYGHYCNIVEFNPAYHHLMERGKAYRLHSLAWEPTLVHSQVGRAALYYLYAQTDQGPTCPLTMTYAAVPVLQQQGNRYHSFINTLLNDQYDPRYIPWTEKTGLTVGMAMTEKQGGSDVRANITQATNTDGHYRLLGHKWFCSAPMSDAFLMLAQCREGLSCFFVPRFTPDGSQNAIDVQRLKNKLGNHSNASSEIELNNAYAELVGEPGRGVATIINMVSYTRFDCTLGSSAHIRQALVQAIHHCQHRKAFGNFLIEQPLMKNVLADAALESEAATQITFWLADQLDQAQRGNDDAQRLARLATAIGKYWVCKRSPMVVGELLECLGGNGYVEDLPMARLYRDAPLNSIWEGSGNIQCLDVLRALQHDPDSMQLLLATIKTGLNESVFTSIRTKCESLLNHNDPSFVARQLVEQLAIALAASLITKHSDSIIADCYIDTRLNTQRNYCLGQLTNSKSVKNIINKHYCNQ